MCYPLAMCWGLWVCFGLIKVRIRLNLGDGYLGFGSFPCWFWSGECSFCRLVGLQIWLSLRWQFSRGSWFGRVLSALFAKMSPMSASSSLSTLLLQLAGAAATPRDYNGWFWHGIGTKNGTVNISTEKEQLNRKTQSYPQAQRQQSLAKTFGFLNPSNSVRA